MQAVILVGFVLVFLVFTWSLCKAAGNADRRLTQMRQDDGEDD